MTPTDLTLPLREALDAVRSLVPPTPLLEVPDLSERVGVPVFLKLENLQVTGSFKVRGAAARILALDDGERGRGVVTCSSGNHGRAVAWVASRVGVPAVVCVPSWVDPVKLEAIQACGAEAVLAGDTYDEAAERAERIREERGLTFVHPFDDPWVAAGQGTVALEILARLPEVGTVVVPLSGGGLVGGIGYALKERAPDLVKSIGDGHGEGNRPEEEEEGGARPVGVPEVVAVSAERARVMLASLEAGHPVELPEEETLASALAGGIDLENRYTYDLVKTYVDRHVLVEEDAIGRAVIRAFRELHLVMEGGGAVGLAAVLQNRLEPLDQRPLVVVVSGGNISEDVLFELLASSEGPEEA